MTTERGSGTAGAGQITKTEASDVTIADAGSLLTATNVEDALQEVVTNQNVHINDLTNPHAVTAAQVGLGITDTPEFAGLDLTPGTAPAHEEGRIAYDSTAKTFIAYNDIPDITLNIGEESWVRVLNNTGSQINNGQTVYISGSTGGVPTVALARADVRTTAEMIGVATHDITNGSQGIITTEGLVRGLDTSVFSGGDHLYLSPITAGLATATKPTGSDYVVELGHVMAVDASDGSFLVNVVHPKDDTDVVNVPALDAANTFSSAQTLSGGAIFAGGGDTLNHYEEGVWTPTIEGTSTTGTASYATQVGSFTRTGNRVTVSYFIDFSSFTGTGNMQIGGLPFTSSSTTDLFNIGSIQCSNITYTGDYVTARIGPSSTKVNPVITTASVSVAFIPVDAAGIFLGTISYEI